MTCEGVMAEYTILGLEIFAKNILEKRLGLASLTAYDNLSLALSKSQNVLYSLSGAGGSFTQGCSVPSEIY